MKSKQVIFVLLFVLIVAAAIGAEKIRMSFSESASPDSNAPKTVAPTVIPQLNSEGREESATMVLLGAPPMQPADHIDRWNPDLHHESCMTCHATPETTGARTVPENHYYDEDRTAGKIFRDNCIQCHATQNDTKTAFNDEE